MRELTTYINEKLDLNKVNLNNKFPIKGNIKDVIKFLKNNGFTEMKQFEHPERTKIDFDNRGRPTYVKSGNDAVYFADTLKKPISKDNLIIYFNAYSKNIAYSDGNVYHYFAPHETDIALELINKVIGL